MADNELILFESQDKSVSLNVPLRNDSVWLNRNQMEELFGRDVKTIGRHIGNALHEEIDAEATVAKFATVQQEGDRRVERWIGNTYQSFGGQEVYPTVEEKLPTCCIS